MKYEANIYQMTVEEHTFWVAESKALKGCVGQGETSDEAIHELETNENEWLETAEMVGIPIPEQSSRSTFKHNGKIALRLAPNVHSEAFNYAAELGISLNQYLSNAIVEYNASTRAFLRKPFSTAHKTGSSDKVMQFPVDYSAPINPVITDEPEEM